MKISKKSLSYQIILWGDITPEWTIPDNLCPFVRMLVLHTLLLLGFIVISSFVSACLIAPVVVMVLSQLTGVFAAKAVLSNLAFVGSILYIATITSFIVMKISDYLRYRKYANYNQQQLKEPREPNIFVAYIKAKHDKICPKIEFVG